MEIFPILMNRAPAAHASEDWSSYKAKDWTLLAISLVILILYEGFYLVIYYFLPHRCTLHRNIVSKSRWIEGILRKKGAEILVVQTLRNGILTGNFFAGTSSTITLYAMGFLFTQLLMLTMPMRSYLPVYWLHNRQISSVTGVAAGQLYAIGVCLFLSFLNWIIVIRNYNHLSFHHFNDIEDAHFQTNEKLKEDATRLSKSLMSRATVHHYIATRFFYLIILVLGWKISPTGMVAAAILLVPWLAYHDFV